MADPRDVLLDDGPLVQVGRHVVGGGADEFHAALVGLGVGAGAFEGGEEGVVDVDDAALHCPAHAVGEDLHVARQHHQFHLLRGDEVEQLLLGPGFRVLRDGDVEEGDAVELGDGRQVRVVAHHRHHLDGQALGALAVEQVREAVALARDHDDGAQAPPQLVDPVVGAELARHVGQALLHGGAARGRVHFHAHEEGASAGVAELLGLDDVAPGRADDAGDGVDDAGAVRARQGENELRVFSHGRQSSHVPARQRGRAAVRRRHRAESAWALRPRSSTDVTPRQMAEIHTLHSVLGCGTTIQ